MKEKYLIKRLSVLMLAAVMFIAAFSVNVAAADEKIYGGVATAQEFQDICQGYMSDAFNLADSDIQYLLEQLEASGEPGPASFLADYSELKGSIGDFVEYSDFNISEEGGVVTAVQTCKFTGGDYDFTFVYDSITGVPVTSFKQSEAVNDDFGSKMAKAGMNTLMGMSTVFCVLIIMIFVISAFKLIAPQEKKKEELPAESFEKQIEAREEVSKQVNDTELVAVIAAAIAASTGRTTDSFVVRSIKRR